MVVPLLVNKLKTIKNKKTKMKSHTEKIRQKEMHPEKNVEDRLVLNNFIMNKPKRDGLIKLEIENYGYDLTTITKKDLKKLYEYIGKVLDE